MAASKATAIDHYLAIASGLGATQLKAETAAMGDSAMTLGWPISSSHHDYKSLVDIEET